MGRANRALAKSRNMKKYYIAAIVSIIYIPLITVSAELFPPLKDFLKNVFWHHWLGKSIILLLLFIATAAIASLFKKDDDNKYLPLITYLSFISSLAILLFFVVEYAKLQ